MHGSRYRATWYATTAVLVGLLACEQPTESGTPTTPLEPSVDLAAVATAQAPEPVGIEREYQDLADRLPSFGGIFLEDGHVLVAYVADVDAPGALDQVRDQFLGTSEKRQQRLLEDGSEPPIQLRKGAYSFTDLRTWKERILLASGPEHELLLVDADERLNRVRVGVGSVEAGTRLTETLDAIGVPAEAVVFDATAGPAVAVQHVQNSDRRPTSAGYQIRDNPFGNEPSCTLGFNVRQGGQRMFLTAAHCFVGGFTGGTGQDVHQNGSAFGEQIGDVHVNPAWSTSCPAGAQFCSSADAVLVKYLASVASADTVVETSFIGVNNSPGNLLVGTRYEVVTIGIPLVGASVRKTGRTTGSTSGAVVSHCVARTYTLQGTVLHNSCASEVDARADGGDSGGPVYMRSGSVAIAVGIVFATNTTGDRRYWYSPWQIIQNRLGFFALE